MGFFSRVENKMEDAIEGAAGKMASAPISPVQIAKQCEKQMKRNKMVGAGKQIAPTLYTVLVNEDDDRRLFGYYPTLAGETETYLNARSHDMGLSMDGNPLVRFIADPALKHGKFDVIAECVASPIIARLRDEEMERYGFEPRRSRKAQRAPQPAPAPVYDEDDYADDYADDFQDEDPFSVDALESKNQPDNFAGFDVPAAGVAAGAATAGAAGAGAVPRARMDLPQAKPLRATLTDRANGRSFTLSASNIKLGRETDNDIVISDMGASRYHATIARGRDCWILTDQNSTNGTLVDGREIETVVLRDGNIITIGTTEYLFTQA